MSILQRFFGAVCWHGTCDFISYFRILGHTYDLAARLHLRKPPCREVRLMLPPLAFERRCERQAMTDAEHVAQEAAAGNRSRMRRLPSCSCYIGVDRETPR